MDPLIRKLSDDDPNALRLLFEAHYGRVCAVIRRFTGSEEHAEDLAQQVFVRLWQKRHQLHIEGPAGAYLHRMAINEALAWLRSRKNQPAEQLPLHVSETLEVQDDPASTLLQEELNELILAAIEALPPRCREVFLLSRYEQLTYPEIAQALGISVKTVENQMGKALRLLRERLAPYLSR